MKTVWTKGLDAERREEVKRDFLSSSLLRSRLKDLLEEKKMASMKAVTLKDSYDSPNWALLQADNIGFIRALEEVISLLE